MEKKGVLKKIVNVVLAVLEISTLGVLLVFPFLSNSLNHVIAQWIFYCSIPVFVGCLLITNNLHKVYDFLKTLLLLFIFVSCFVINYHNTSYNWYWFAFILIAIAVPFGGTTIKQFALKRKDYTEEQNKNFKINITKYTLFYLLVDLFYMSLFLDNLISKFIFGGLVMLIVFYNLSIVFLSGKSACKFMLLHDLIIGLLLTVYLIYIIPSQDIKDIVIPLVSSVYGGILTLVGVAWTIKKTDSDRKEERKNSVKPYLYPISYRKELSNNLIYAEFFRNNQSKISNCIGVIQNTDNGIFVLKEIVINGNSYKISATKFIDKNMAVKLFIYDEKQINIESIFLVGTDVLGNVIKYKLKLNKEQNVIESLVEEE